VGLKHINSSDMHITMTYMDVIQDCRCWLWKISSILDGELLHVITDESGIILLLCCSGSKSNS